MGWSVQHRHITLNLKRYACILTMLLLTLCTVPFCTSQWALNCCTTHPPPPTHPPDPFHHSPGAATAAAAIRSGGGGPHPVQGGSGWHDRLRASEGRRCKRAHLSQPGTHGRNADRDAHRTPAIDQRDSHCCCRGALGLTSHAFVFRRTNYLMQCNIMLSWEWTRQPQQAQYCSQWCPLVFVSKNTHISVYCLCRNYCWFKLTSKFDPNFAVSVSPLFYRSNFRTAKCSSSRSAGGRTPAALMDIARYATPSLNPILL